MEEYQRNKSEIVAASGNEGYEDMLNWVRARQPKEHTNVTGHAGDIGASFLNELTNMAVGDSYLSYAQREETAKMSSDDSLGKYRELTRGGDWQDRYRPELFDGMFAERLREKFKNNLVLDLGVGDKAAAYILADSFGAGCYIGVEMNNAASAQQWCERYRGEVPFVIAQEDMGTFLEDFSSLGSKADVVFFSGIENTSYTGRRPYSEVLSNIYKVLSNDGILIFGGNMAWAREEYGAEFDKYFTDTGEGGRSWMICLKRLV